MAHVACGIDIGGSGVKGALVDLETGEYIGNQVRIPTPDPATPDAVAAVCREVIDQLDVKIGVPIGVTFPAPVFDGVIPYMANLDQSWVNVDVDELMERYLGRSVIALNDADAAGIAEVAYGAAKGRDGVIVFTTQGTGIGSATTATSISPSFSASSSLAVSPSCSSSGMPGTAFSMAGTRRGSR